MVKSFLNLFVIITISSCAGITIPNTEGCAVAGTFRAGMNCATTLTNEKRTMNMDEALDFLEPQNEIKDESGKVISKARGPAICQSLDDYVAIKNSIEKACRLMKKKCSYEIKNVIKKLESNIEYLSDSRALKSE